MVQERGEGVFNPGQKLSQRELEPKVRDLFNEFKQALIEDPQFQKDLAKTFLSTFGIGQSKRKGYLPVAFNRGLDRWVVRYSLEEEYRTIFECLKVTVDRPSEHTRGFRIITLRMPYLSDKENGDDVDISYDQRTLLGFSSPTDIHKNRTLSALTEAEQMLADLKATS